MAITKRIRRYPLPGESPYHTFYPEDERGEDCCRFGDEDGGGGAGESERGCGFRQEGGTYAVVPTSTSGRGRQIEHFTLCAPLRIDADEYGLTAMGTKLIDIPETCGRCGGGGKLFSNEEFITGAPGHDCSGCGGLGLVPITHVFDIIGREAYPNVTDFLEEARRLGVSRRLELADSTQYARLTPRSRLFLLHSRAIIENPGEYWEAMARVEGAPEAKALADAGGCPKSRPEHALAPPPIPGALEAPGCSALFWHDLDPDTVRPAAELCNNCGDILGGYAPETCPDCSQPNALAHIERFSGREMPSFNYGGFTRPEGIKPLHSLGVFAIFPLARLEVVDSSGGDEYSAAVDRASAAKLPVKITDC